MYVSREENVKWMGLVRAPGETTMCHWHSCCVEIFFWTPQHIQYTTLRFFPFVALVVPEQPSASNPPASIQCSRWIWAINQFVWRCICTWNREMRMRMRNPPSPKRAACCLQIRACLQAILDISMALHEGEDPSDEEPSVQSRHIPKGIH